MNINAEAFIRRWGRRALDARFHRIHRVQAMSIHRTIQRSIGPTNRIDLNRADAYAREVLGHSHYAPWLYVYTALAGCFKEGWIPDNYYGHVVVPKLKGGYGKASSLKSLQSGIFGEEAFPDVAYFANGLFFLPGNAVIAPDLVARRLFAEHESLVFKVDNSLQGKGIYFVDRTTFDVRKIKALGNGVFQERIAQHEVLSQFARRSVATLRLTTAVSDEGAVSVRACYLRIGRDSDTHVQSTTHVRIPVDCATGELSPDGYLTDWTVVREHPDSKVRFAGVTIPAFADCLKTVLDHHKKVPFARCVGWDVAVDYDERVKLMEWNAEHNDIKFSEATQGPCFADLRWERLIREETGQAKSKGQLPSAIPDRSRAL